MLGAFDWANHRNLEAYNSALIRKFSYTYGTVFYFSRTIYERIHERIFHVYGLAKSENVYQWMHGETAQEVGADKTKLDKALELISSRPEKPFFLSMHLLETHCCPFLGIDNPYQKDKSVLQESYKKAIYRNDQYLEYFVQGLKDKDLLDNTIFVYFSDHGPRLETNPGHRVPLLIRFPDAEHKMLRNHYAQLNDIAPTLLDYMGVQVPEWMDGHSLLQELDPKKHQEIFQIYNIKTRRVQLGLTPRGEPVFFNQLSHIGPPYFGITEVIMIHCNFWYHLNLETPIFNWGQIENAPSVCVEGQITKADARQRIFAFMDKHQIGLPAYLDTP